MRDAPVILRKRAGLPEAPVRVIKFVHPVFVDDCSGEQTGEVGKLEISFAVGILRVLSLPPNEGCSKFKAVRSARIADRAGLLEGVVDILNGSKRAVA